MNDYRLSEDVKLTKLLYKSINRKFSLKPTTNRKHGIKINIELIVRAHRKNICVDIEILIFYTKNAWHIIKHNFIDGHL